MDIFQTFLQHQVQKKVSAKKIAYVSNSEIMATQIKLKKFCYINLVSKSNKIRVCFVARIRRLRQGMFSVAPVSSHEDPFHIAPGLPLPCPSSIPNTPWDRIPPPPARLRLTPCPLPNTSCLVGLRLIRCLVLPLRTFHFKQISNVLNFRLFATLDSGLRVKFRNAFRL